MTEPAVPTSPPPDIFRRVFVHSRGRTTHIEGGTSKQVAEHVERLCEKAQALVDRKEYTPPTRDELLALCKYFSWRAEDVEIATGISSRQWRRYESTDPMEYLLIPEANFCRLALRVLVTSVVCMKPKVSQADAPGKGQHGLP